MTFKVNINKTLKKYFVFALIWHFCRGMYTKEILVIRVPYTNRTYCVANVRFLYKIQFQVSGRW